MPCRANRSLKSTDLALRLLQQPRWQSFSNKSCFFLPLHIWIELILQWCYNGVTCSDNPHLCRVPPRHVVVGWSSLRQFKRSLVRLGSSAHSLPACGVLFCRETKSKFCVFCDIDGRYGHRYWVLNLVILIQACAGGRDEKLPTSGAEWLLVGGVGGWG